MLTLIVFIIWLVFFDHNDIFLQMKRTSELRQLRKRKAYYRRTDRKNEKRPF